MDQGDAWSGIVRKKSRGLFDGSNLYRRLEVEFDDGAVRKIKVNRDLWKQLEVGDRVVKDAGSDPSRG